MKYHWVFLVLAICLIFPSLGLAGNLGWQRDIARQLVAEDWDLPESQGRSVIGYALYLVEIEESLIKQTGLDFDLAVGGRESGLRLTSGKESELIGFFASSIQFSPSLVLTKSDAKRAVSASSWLLTVSGKPLTISVASLFLPTTTNQPKEEKFEVNLLPLNINAANLIETEVTVAYTDETGTELLSTSTVLVGSALEEPIAVVTRQVDAGKRRKNQYFALYLAGILIPPEVLPEQAAFLPFGSVAELEIFWEKTPEIAPGELDFAISFNQEGLGWSLGSTLPYGNYNHVYGIIQSEPELIFNLGIAAGLNRELRLVAEAGNYFTEEFSLSLGVSDELQIGENLHVAVLILPLQIKFTPKIEQHLAWQVAAAYELAETKAWYQIENRRKTIRHSGGLTFLISRDINPKLQWSWDNSKGHRITAGLGIKF